MITKFMLYQVSKNHDSGHHLRVDDLNYKIEARNGDDVCVLVPVSSTQDHVVFSLNTDQLW